jgi:PAS domain S-box-containing protein
LPQCAILIALAATATWLSHRADTLERNRELARRSRSLADLVAHAVGPEISEEASARARRVLSAAARDGVVRAAAVIDARGTVVAHTDLGRVGERAAPELETATLFPGSAGHRFDHVLLGPYGSAGTLVLLVPDPQRDLAGALRFAVPPALMLLASLIVARSTIRRTLRRNTEFLRRLAALLEGGAPGAQAPREPQAAMDRTITLVHGLAEAKHDLTVRNQILSYKKQKMELVLERFPDGLLVTDPARNVFFVNRAAIRALGPAGRELAGRNLRDCAPELRRLVDEADRSGSACVPRQLAGPDRSLSLIRAPILDSANQTLGTLYTVRDVTAQQAAQRAQTEFLSQVTHELKAPLHTIVTYVEELADDEELTREERREYANTLDAEVDRMAQLITNLLQLSRIQLGNLSAQRTFVRPAPLITDQAGSLRAAAEERQLALQIAVPENLPAVHADKDLLGVAITNLVSNSIKYTKPGGRILVTGNAVAGGISIEVSDTGVGIPKEDQGRVFERFVRSQQEWVQQQSGSGLGLSLVKEIVEIHDGQISLESAEGHGTTVRIWLPCREAGTRADVVEALT